MKIGGLSWRKKDVPMEREPTGSYQIGLGFTKSRWVARKMVLWSGMPFAVSLSNAL
jgi:hypothetical protein